MAEVFVMQVGYLKNMDLKKPRSMEDWFIMTESSWL